MQDLFLTLAGDEFHAPLGDLADPGELYLPTGVPEAWTCARQGIWTLWAPPHAVPVDSGWKIHVAAAADRVQYTVDVVAAACVEHGVAFKHLAASAFYLALHHKHASREQAGKLCAIYPPDPAVAKDLLDRLAADLRAERGPYVLTDRRYGEQGVVFYRYGGHSVRTRLALDGTSQPLVRDGHGNDVDDRRLPSFVLPEGIEDPFAGPPVRRDTGPVVLDGRFEVQAAIRHSNGGGTYRALDRDTGDTVFVKEARGHNGLFWNGTDAVGRLRNEHRTLCSLNEVAPGLCPRPIAQFAQWEHEFLVTEHIDGLALQSWLAINGVLHRRDTTPVARTAYLRRVERILASLREAVDRLHDNGTRFGDLSHGNVVVTADDTVRLVDFETANPVTEPQIPMLTPGYAPPEVLVEAGVGSDEYGFAALSMLLLTPLASPLERDPAGRLDLVRRDLTEAGPIPEPLWQQATKYYRMLPAVSADSLPTAQQLDEQPLESLRLMADGLVEGILADARPDHDGWVFPPPVEAFSVNTHCMAYGTAGVLHALHQSRVDVPDDVLARFRADAARHGTDLAPGLQVGMAGLAWTLAEFGDLDQAADLVRAAHAHPLLARSATLAHGRAGVGLTSLLLHRRTGDEAHLSTACAAADAVLAGVPAGIATPGLDHGCSGVAWFLEALGAATGEHRYLDAALRVMHAELDKASDGNEMLFRDHDGQRVISYLSIGSAGVLTALTRIARRTGDDRCLAALPLVAPICRAHTGVEPGLYTGVSSWVYALAEHASGAGTPADQAMAVRIATSLAKHLIRRPGGGLRSLGSFGLRFHSDLAGGGAGVLLALARVLDGARASLFDPQNAGAPSTPVR